MLHFKEVQSLIIMRYVIYFLMLYVTEMIKDNPCDFYQVGAKLTEFFTAAAINKSMNNEVP